MAQIPMNDAGDPRLVAAPMSIPRICHTDANQQAAASATVNTGTSATGRRG